MPWISLLAWMPKTWWTLNSNNIHNISCNIGIIGIFIFMSARTPMMCVRLAAQVHSRTCWAKLSCYAQLPFPYLSPCLRKWACRKQVKLTVKKSIGLVLIKLTQQVENMTMNKMLNKTELTNYYKRQEQVTMARTQWKQVWTRTALRQKHTYAYA